MLVIGIIFLILFTFFSLCLIGTLANINNVLQLIVNRQDEIIRVIKNSK